jgi:hypothetical protein
MHSKSYTDWPYFLFMWSIQAMLSEARPGLTRKLESTRTEEQRRGWWWVLLETDHMLALLLLEHCHNPVSRHSLGYFSYGVIYFVIDVYTFIETCAMYLPSDYSSYIICSTCPASWTSLPRTLKSKSLIIYSLSPSFAKLIAVLSLSLSLSRNSQRTCYKNINCQQYSYIVWQNELLQWRLVRYWRWKTETKSWVVRFT